MNVTDEMVRLAGNVLMQHGINAPEQEIYRAARAALEAALALVRERMGEPVAWTNAHQLEFPHKRPGIIIAEACERFDGIDAFDVPLYASPLGDMSRAPRSKL